MENSLVNDILALLHAREAALHSEIEQLGEIRRFVVPGSATGAATPLPGATVADVKRQRAPLSAEARKRISLAQKARWRKARKNGKA